MTINERLTGLELIKATGHWIPLYGKPHDLLPKMNGNRMVVLYQGQDSQLMTLSHAIMYFPRYTVIEYVSNPFAPLTFTRRIRLGSLLVGGTFVRENLQQRPQRSTRWRSYSDDVYSLKDQPILTVDTIGSYVVRVEMNVRLKSHQFDDVVTRKEIVLALKNIDKSSCKAKPVLA